MLPEACMLRKLVAGWQCSFSPITPVTPTQIATSVIWAAVQYAALNRYDRPAVRRESTKRTSLECRGIRIVGGKWLPRKSHSNCMRIKYRQQSSQN